MRCAVILIVRVFLLFLNPQHQPRRHRITLTFTSLPSPRAGRRHGGRSSRRSRAAALDQSACNEWGDRRPANQIPRQEERAPRDVTTPPGQSRSLPPVLASERDEERFCVPKPASERGRVARSPPPHPRKRGGGYNYRRSLRIRLFWVCRGLRVRRCSGPGKRCAHGF